MSSPLVFFQLAVADPAATHAFLDELFGWEPAAPDDTGTIPVRPGGPGDFDVTGTLPPLVEERQQTTLYFRVEDLWATVARAEELGGTIVMPIRRAAPDGPHISIVTTPRADLTIGIVQA